MNLTKLLADSVALAKEITIEGWEWVDWTFISNDEVEFDAESDTLTGTSTTKRIQILLYTDTSNDTGNSFSSVGRFLDSPVERSNSDFMMIAAEAAPHKPTINDFFIDEEGLKHVVRSVDRIPTQPVFLGKQSLG